jgi:Na+-driven multidrug efflux pump
VGRKDQADANLVFNQALGLAAACGVLTWVAGSVFAGLYMRMVAADEATVAAGTTYLLWFMPALALQFASRVMGAALSGTGIVRPGMIVQALAVLINIALAPVLIAGWGTGLALGVAGAGLASSLAVLMGVLMMWFYFRRLERYVGFDPAQIRPQLAQWKRILDVGLPAGGEFAIIFLWMGVIYYALRDFGAAAQAGFGIGTRVLGLIQMPALAIAIAAGPIAGQNFGAGNAARVRETFTRAAMIVTVVMIAFTILSQWQPGLLRWLRQRRPDIGGRCPVPSDGLPEPRRTRIELRVQQHVSGTGQHQASAAQFRRALDYLLSAGALAVGAARVSH